ncbi:MFS transporter [Herbaspirillum sp. SJZ107]|uniref:MFS transporter n=1 Tax=Herbaspirillum sp. SJZ107 TaxID=2572881 RepID=UPI001150EF25|nr:MFS transporter [Herbaspirillum sp. SJZ107]TQK07841.1 D-galactonate transporter [Herbaspirillum sp. SJZ107]
MVNSYGTALGDDEHRRARVYKKIWWRIIPLLFICYGLAFIDRINIGFTKLQMTKDLGIDATWYGIAAGVFFITYALCEIPSNMYLEKWGARRTFVRIMVLWGLVTAATAFISSVTHLIVLRMLLGAFEAGFLPGIILYLTFWFPTHMRARVTAVIFVANAVAGSIAAPLTGWIMTSMNGLMGMAGWKWVFIVEGLPACILGVIAFFVLRDKPDDAEWLTAPEKALVKADLAAEAVPTEAHGAGLIGKILRNPKNFMVALLWFTAICSNYLLFFWLPTIVQESGVKSLATVGLITALPLALGFVGAVVLSWTSDRYMERRWHLIFIFLLIAVGLVAATAAQSLTMTLAAFAVASFATGASGPLIWSLPPAYLDKKTAPVGIAFISTLGNVGGFVSPSLLGYVKTTTGSLSIGVLGIAALAAVCMVLVAFAVPRKKSAVVVQAA